MRMKIPDDEEEDEDYESENETWEPDEEFYESNTDYSIKEVISWPRKHARYVH